MTPSPYRHFTDRELLAYAPRGSADPLLVEDLLDRLAAALDAREDAEAAIMFNNLMHEARATRAEDGSHAN